jgi:phage gp29-like protein
MTPDLRLNSLPRPGEIAGRNTDPRFYAALAVLPNPDPILRKAGRSEEVFESIQADAHVIGELRLIRADLLRFKLRLTAGGDSRKDKYALELCQNFLARAPAPMMTWPDAIWNIGLAPFRGHSVHEIVWQRDGDQLMPARLLDRPQRRFKFDQDGALKLITRDDPLFGVPAEEAYFLVNRHMPSYDNPYGVALFSSCFWPYTFKHAGFRWFVKFCERFGIPFPIGKYPAGTPDEQITKLEQGLESLIEAGYAALQEDGAVELLESKTAGGGGKIVQQQLVEAANAEISKALSSQTLSTEQTGSSGSRGAAEVHRGRSLDVGESDRDSIAFTLDGLWARITLFNFGPDAKPPRSEFVAEEDVTKDRAEIYEIFGRMGGKPSREAMAAELDIELADPLKPEDQMQPPPVQAPGVPADPAGLRAATFARADAPFADQGAIDDANLDARLQPIAEQMLKPLIDELRNGLTPDQLLQRLASLYPKLDDSALQEMVARVIFVADVWGRLSAEGQVPGTGDG